MIANQTLPARPATTERPRSIVVALEATVGTRSRVTIFDSGGNILRSLKHSEIRDRARSLATRLASLGFARHQIVGIVANTDVDFLVSFYACQYAGLIACNLPNLHTSVGRANYRDEVGQLVERSRLPLVIGPEELRATLGQTCDALAARYLTIADLQDLPECDATLAPLGPDEPAYVQFSSGTTTAPRGMLISQAAVCANVNALCELLQVGHEDRAFSWLPFNHDMGFVGMVICPLFSAIDVDYMSPRCFVRSPPLWLTLMSERQTSITYAPPFALSACTRHLAARPRDLDLAKLRVLGLGAEPIRPDVVNAFTDVVAEAGFPASAFRPSYGMAETTLAITVGRGISLERPDTAGDDVICCGSPLPGVELQIVDSAGKVVKDGSTGEIRVRSPSLFSRHEPTGEAPRLSTDGFYATGDIGFMRHGALFVCGRTTELVIVNGRKIWLQEAEGVARRVIAGEHGSVSATRSGDRIVIAIKSRAQGEALEALCADVRSAIFRDLRVSCDVVGSASIGLTSSGKLKRPGIQDATTTP